MKLYLILMGVFGVDDHFESVHHIYKEKKEALHEAQWQNEHTEETGRFYDNYTVYAVNAKKIGAKRRKRT